MVAQKKKEKETKKERKKNKLEGNTRNFYSFISGSDIYGNFNFLIYITFSFGSCVILTPEKKSKHKKKESVPSGFGVSPWEAPPFGKRSASGLAPGDGLSGPGDTEGTQVPEACGVGVVCPQVSLPSSRGHSPVHQAGPPASLVRTAAAEASPDCGYGHPYICADSSHHHVWV